jgi:hypothetical protein
MRLAIEAEDSRQVPERRGRFLKKAAQKLFVALGLRR